MQKIAIVAQDQFLTQWEKELDELHKFLNDQYKNKFHEAEAYLSKLGLLPRGFDPKTWESGVIDGIFCVKKPSDACQDCGEEHGEVFGMELPKEVGEKLVNILRMVSKNPKQSV